MAGAYHDFISMKHLGLLLLPPRRDASPSQGYLPVRGNSGARGTFSRTRFSVLLVFSVTPFKIDQNKKQNRSIDKVQNLGNERR